METPDTLRNKLSNEERETHINLTADDRLNNLAHIHTDDPVVYRQLLRKGHVPTFCDGERAKLDIEWRLISIRKNAPKKPGPEMTEEQKKKAIQRLTKSRAKEKP